MLALNGMPQALLEWIALAVLGVVAFIAIYSIIMVAVMLLIAFPSLSVMLTK